LPRPVSGRDIEQRQLVRGGRALFGRSRMAQVGPIPSVIERGDNNQP
jgi:hypothetical protein